MISLIKFFIYQLAEEIAMENEDLKKRRLRTLNEENEALKKNFSSLRGDLKKKDRVLIDLQEKLAFYENAYNEITLKFEDSHYKKLEKLFNFQVISNIPEPKEEFNEGNPLEKGPIFEILQKRPKENPQTMGIFH